MKKCVPLIGFAFLFFTTLRSAGLADVEAIPLAVIFTIALAFAL